MPSKGRKPAKPWSLYPSLHEEVSRLLGNDDLAFSFHGADDSRSNTHEYDTHIMGRFICHNSACVSSGWMSKKIPITIRMYSGAQYNARVYHQRCQNCNRLSRPILNDSYADRVAYRIKKWRGIQLDRPFFVRRIGKPHNRYLCEGCKDGHCRESGLEWI